MRKDILSHLTFRFDRAGEAIQAELTPHPAERECVAPLLPQRSPRPLWMHITQPLQQHITPTLPRCVRLPHG